MTNRLGKLKNIAIQDEPNNIKAIFADDVSVSNIIQTIFAFLSFFLIILTLGLFAPKQSEIVNTTLNFNSNPDHGDSFTSSITNISSINQKLRISILYDNATLKKEFANPIITYVSVNLYDKKGNKIESLSSSNSIQYDRPVPLFQTSILSFEKLEMNVSMSTKIDHKHSATLKYEYVPSETSFFQLKIRAILSIISISIFVFISRTMSRTTSQIMTLFIHAASLFVFNPIHILFTYFPSIYYLCFDFIFKNVGFAYVYIYSNMIFFTFEKKVGKYTIVSNVFLFILLLFVLLAKDFNSLSESYPTIFPIEFNGFNYNTNKFINDVKIKGNFDTESMHKRTFDMALKLAFLNSSTIEELNLNLREFSFIILLFLVPVFVSILYSIFNVQDVYFHRIIMLAVTVAVFAVGLTIFCAVDVIGATFNGKLIKWIVPLASLSTFTLILTYLNMEDDRNSTYEYVMQNDEKIGNIDEIKMDGDNLGLEEDDEQILRKEIKK